MSDQTPAQRFGAALQELENSGNNEQMLGQFADSPRLLRPEAKRSGSSGEDAASFWQRYLDQFSKISTEFVQVQEGDGFAALEWTSRGTLASGRDIEYNGVSLLSYGEDGRISRFATYYDSAAFLEPTS